MICHKVEKIEGSLTVIPAGDGRHQTDFNHIYRCFYEPLLHYASSFLGSNLFAEDIIQEVFLKFWHVDQKRTEVRNPKSFLFSMTRNLCVSKLRCSSRDRKNRRYYYNQESFASITEYMIEEMEYQRFLQEAIKHLPPQRKKVFILIKMEGWKRAEAARMLCISEEAVKEAMRQALKTIRGYICLKTGIENKQRNKAK